MNSFETKVISFFNDEERADMAFLLARELDDPKFFRQGSIHVALAGDQIQKLLKERGYELTQENITACGLAYALFQRSQKVCQYCKETQPKAQGTDKPVLQLLSDAKRCTQCHSVYYCDKECQRMHWPVHKEHCKLYTVNLFHAQQQLEELVKKGKQVKPAPVAQ
jgi:hypothetical protein